MARRLLTALVSSLYLCAGTAVGGDLIVTDDTGKQLQLASPARRVVSLAPDLTELAFAAGAGRWLVAVAEHSDYPEAARVLPRIGDAHGFDFERLITLKPDLVLAWTGGNSPQHLAKLKAMGLRVYHSDIRQPEDIARTIERLALLTGETGVAQVTAEALRLRWRELEARYAKKRRLKVFYQVWGQPLYTLGGPHLISAALRVCGAENVYADLAVLAASIEIESVLQRNPEVIVAAAEGARRPAWLDAWRRWPTLTAARRDALHVVDADLLNRHSPRFVEGTARLCATLDAERSKALE